MIAAVLAWQERVFRLQLQFFSPCYVGINYCNVTPFLYSMLSFQNIICNDFVPNGKRRITLKQANLSFGSPSSKPLVNRTGLVFCTPEKKLLQSSRNQSPSECCRCTFPHVKMRMLEAVGKIAWLCDPLSVLKRCVPETLAFAFGLRLRSKTRSFKTRVLGRRLPNRKPQERLRSRTLRGKTLAFKKRIAIVFLRLKDFPRCQSLRLGHLH